MIAPLTNTGPPATRNDRLRRWLLATTAIYLLVLLALLYANEQGPERWWWSTLNLYLPQWLWALPGVALLAALLRVAARWAWMPVLGVLAVLGPLMGLEWAPRAAVSTRAGAGLRVMTYNVQWGREGAGQVAAEIAAARPDLLFMQDARQVLDGPVGAVLSGWHRQVANHYVIASRWPLTPGPAAPQLPAGLPPTNQYSRLQLGERAVSLYNAHLPTPRDALVTLRFEGLDGLRLFDHEAGVRLFAAATLAEALRAETGPVLVAGDLDAPVQSLVCRALLHTGLEDAFCAAGVGYGYTFGHSLRLRHSFVRLDHILVSRQWRVLRCWTGSAAGSDHRPVIADLVLDG